MVDLEMSNFDNSIDDGLAYALQSENVFAHYVGWNFVGKIIAEADKFVCQVWIHKRPVEEVIANTLLDIMTKVSRKYGSE